MTVCGKIVKLKNNIAYVRTARPSSCEGCANAGICHREDVELTAINEADGCPGDIVEVETDDSARSLGAIAYIFLVPVAILFIGVFLFSIYPWAAAACIPLIAVYFVFLKKLNSSWKPAARVVMIKEKASEREDV